MGQVLEGKGTEEGKTAHVHLLRARCGTVGTDKHGVGTKTLRSPGPSAARDVEELVGRDCASNVERNQTEESQKCSWALLQAAYELQVREGYDGTRAGLDTRRITTRWSRQCWESVKSKKLSESSVWRVGKTCACPVPRRQHTWLTI